MKQNTRIVKPKKNSTPKKHSHKAYLDEKHEYVLTENQKSLQTKHRSFLSIYKGYTGASNKKVLRPFVIEVSTKDGYKSETKSFDKGQIIVPKMMNDMISKDTIKMAPEGFVFLLSLEGCPKNLLLFLILMKVKRGRGENPLINFPFNKQVRDQFNDFCELTLGERYREGTIDKAITELKLKNAIVTNARCLYYLNPLIIAGVTYKEKNSALYKYSVILLQKKKDTILDFYPKYME